MADVTRNDSIKEFVSGEKFLLRGRRYPLKVRSKETILPSLSFQNSMFLAEVPVGVLESKYYSLLRPLFIQYYRQKAEQVIRQRVAKYQQYFSDEPYKIMVVSLKNRWGSCSPKNQISYNWRIVMAKTSVLDYVVVHELCHMKYKNHSKLFWDEVKRIIPDYNDSKEWLRLHGDLLKI